MGTLTVGADYPALLRKVPRKVIRTEKENEAYTEILYDLDRRSESLSQAEKELADLLTLLIEDSEEKRYQLPRSKQLDVLRFLMEQHGQRTHQAIGCAVPCLARTIFLTKNFQNNQT